MVGTRYVFDCGANGLGWVTVTADGVQILKKDLSYAAYSLSLHTVDEIGGAEKLANEQELLTYLAGILSDEVRLTVSDFKKVLLAAGEFMPRIWRGYRGNPLLEQFDVLQPQKVYGRSFMSSVVAAESLFKSVNEVFRYVEPDQANYHVFSHKLRELLILLCTEIEANWRSVFELNFPTRKVGRLTTNNYVELIEPLKLRAYKAYLKDYPHCSFSPYAYWNEAKPTESLSWYNDYNAVKHDRESKFNHSTLEAVLDACAALHVLQVAQWGPNVFDVMSYDRYSIFNVDVYPDIPIGEVYTPADNTKSDFTTSRPLETISST